MTRPRREIISRIKACLKLAAPETNSNEHERDTARKAAERLISKYQVTAKELGTINSEEWVVEVTVTEFENLGTVLESLKKSGFKPSKRGWSNE